MITLYQFATSPFTEKVRRALHYKGLDFEIHEVARAEVGQGKYADVSPTGKFPCLKDGDKCINDSTDIIYYLDESYADKPVIPADGKTAALAHALEEWSDESLYFLEMTMRLSWEHNLEAALDEFAATMPGVPKEQLKPMIMQGVTQLVSAQGLGRKPVEQIVADCRRHFDKLEALLAAHDYLLGTLPCYADFAVVGQINALIYAQEAKAMLAKCPNIQAWIKRLDEIAPK